MRYKCIVMYDGTLFNGFQTQNLKDKVNPRTVQEEIENVIEIITGKKTPITYASRTDSGVHALGQVFHFDTTIKMSELSMKRAINSHLKEDIYVKSVEIVSDDFNARSNVIKKEYKYVMNLGEYDPMYRNYMYFPRKANLKTFDMNRMKEASTVLIGEHDFRSFTKAKDLATYTRTIYDISFDYKENILTIYFEGNGFLHNMVRILAAMLLECALGKCSTSELKMILEQKNRQFAPKILPSCGLYLVRVDY